MCLWAAASVWAGEQVVLSSGFRIVADRHEAEGVTLKLYTRSGVIVVPAASVVAIEEEEYVPLPPVPPPPAPALPETPRAAPASDPRALLDQAAEKYGLPREFLHSVARTESAYRPDAVSPKGAIGVMQLMPATAASLNADPRDPTQNIDAGARHLAELLVQYNGSAMKALAAYNAGPGAVSKYNGVPPYPETRLYVEKVLRGFQRQNQPPSR